jgi:hypothetical protein
MLSRRGATTRAAADDATEDAADDAIGIDTGPGTAVE